MNIYQRLNKVREAVAYLQKDKQVGSGGWGYKAVTHDAVTAAVRPHLIQHGVVVVPNVATSSVVLTGTTTGKGVPYIRYEARFDVHFVNADAPEDRVTVTLEAHALDDGDKAPGKAASYATKYAMLKLLSIETGEEDESREPQKPESAKKVSQVAFEELPEKAQGRLADIAAEVSDAIKEGKEIYAVEIYNGHKAELSADEQVALWSLFSTAERSTIKRVGKSQTKKEAA